MTRDEVQAFLLAANRRYFHKPDDPGGWPGHDGVPDRCWACTMHATAAAEAVAELLELPKVAS